MKKYKLKAILAISILLISSLVPATIGTAQTVNAEKSNVKTIKKSSVKNPKGVSSLKLIIPNGTTTLMMMCIGK